MVDDICHDPTVLLLGNTAGLILPILPDTLDLENEFGLTEGNLNHGEMTLDQFFFMRPTISSAQYKSPIENLYLCGPGTHPGGGLHGANGFNAAKEILKG